MYQLLQKPSRYFCYVQLSLPCARVATIFATVANDSSTYSNTNFNENRSDSPAKSWRDRRVAREAMLGVAQIPANPRAVPNITLMKSATFISCEPFACYWIPETKRYLVYDLFLLFRQGVENGRPTVDAAYALPTYCRCGIRHSIHSR